MGNYILYVRRCLSLMISDMLRLEHRPDRTFIPAFPWPHRVQRIGTLGDGGK